LLSSRARETWRRRSSRHGAATTWTPTGRPVDSSWCDRRATRGAAGGAVGVPRVAGDAEGGALGEADRPELGGGRLAEQHEAGVGEPAPATSYRSLIGSGTPWRGGRSAGDAAAISASVAAVAASRNLVVGPEAEGVEPAVELAHPVEVGLGHLRFDHTAHRLAGGASPARVAAEGGYADQSHLHREGAGLRRDDAGRRRRPVVAGRG
jgi:hypothetical protein